MLWIKNKELYVSIEMTFNHDSSKQSPLMFINKINETYHPPYFFNNIKVNSNPISKVFWFQKQPPEVIYKAVLKNFAIFTGKHLFWSLFLIRFQPFRPATLLKRDSNTGVFPWNLRNFKENYFEEHLRTVASVVWSAIHPILLTSTGKWSQKMLIKLKILSSLTSQYHRYLGPLCYSIQINWLCHGNVCFNFSNHNSRNFRRETLSWIGSRVHATLTRI